MKTKIFAAALFIAVLASVSFAQTSGGITGVRTAVETLCTSLVDLLPVVSMLMIIGAGVVYAAGQIMGAETRARANTWATAMLIGAIIGILIVTVAPTILKTMYGPTTGAGQFKCGSWSVV